MDYVGGAIFGLFFIGFMLLSIGGLVFWIFKIVEVTRIPEYQYQAAGTEKITWVVVVALAQAIGALIWHFAKRRSVLDAAGRMPSVAPGWYPAPGTEGLRWWDGTRWTEHNHPS